MKFTGSKLIYVLFLLLLGRVMLDLTGCTHDDVLLDEYIPSAEANETDLVSLKVTTPPTIDGNIDAKWDDAEVLKTRTVVPPQLGPDNVYQNFYGYPGKAFNVALRSMYDNDNVYFLVEWDDNTESLDRETWYFNPATKRWAQENRYPTFNASGQLIRQAFYEDKFAFLWNVNNSVADWNTKTCFASCHTGLGQAAGYARHYTNAAAERIDMWHWKRVREGFHETVDDQYQDNTQPNGRKSDPKTAGSGYADNKQTLNITGTTTAVSVPKYVIPGKTYYYWITKDEIDNGTAKTITAVDDQGVLTYNGGTIDPNADTQFQRDGSRSGAKGIPSVFIAKTLGNGGDITGKFKYTGSGWVMEIQRKLKTTDTENVDVDFSSLADQYFGIAVFENAAIAHAIKGNLVLKFKK